MKNRLVNSSVKLLCLGGVVLRSIADSPQVAAPGDSSAVSPGTNARSFAGKGIVQQLKPDAQTVVIAHEAISNYMAAMTMPFKVRQARELAGLAPGDEVTFHLIVNDNESWIEQVAKTGNRVAAKPETRNSNLEADSPSPRPSHHPILDVKFTNELGQAVSLGQFDGQALAVTFFFTRCPIPDYCPRLSRNFEEASRALYLMPNAPTNWHLLSVSFDTAYDTPAVLKNYAQFYHYDPKHWSFLTGSPDKIAELARQAGVAIEKDGDFFNHGFRTLIIDAAGRLQMSFPIGGNLSDAIVSELIKGAGATNKAPRQE